MFENRVKENKGRTAQKHKKLKCGAREVQLSKVHACNIWFLWVGCLLKRVYSSSTKMSMILSVSILLNCSRARIAAVNSSRVTWDKEKYRRKNEEIRTNLSILILVHFSKGARRDEFFWGLGIKLWPLSVSFRPLSFTLPKSSLDTWQFGSLNYLNSDIYLFIWLSKLCTFGVLGRCPQTGYFWWITHSNLTLTFGL